MITTYQDTINDSIDTRSEAIANKALRKIDVYFQKSPIARKDANLSVREIQSHQKPKGKR